VRRPCLPPGAGGDPAAADVTPVAWSVMGGAPHIAAPEKCRTTAQGTAPEAGRKGAAKAAVGDADLGE
jgi:hypothetical protein